MKFSEKKKAKMKKTRQRRVNRECGNMIGCAITDYDEPIYKEVIDQARLGGTQYLLVECSENNLAFICAEDISYFIYKVVRFGEYVELSPKRVLEKKDAFSNGGFWKNKHKVHISDDGNVDVETNIATLEQVSKFFASCM